jgi:FixJ family two-component response regulator
MSDVSPIVHLVDDDPSYLNATARLLRASKLIVKVFTGPREFLDALEADASGCVVVDLHMPGMNGLELQAALASGGSAMPVIFLTGHGDIPTGVSAMRNGAEDFLEKRAPKEKLLDAVQRALARNAAERKKRQHLGALRSRFDALTEREFEVLGHVVQGKLNKQIAADLGIHERTVKLHRTAITSKLGVPSVAELTRLVQDAGLFSGGAFSFPKGQ